MIKGTLKPLLGQCNKHILDSCHSFCGKCLRLYMQKSNYWVIPILKDGGYLQIESTCPVGATEKISELIFSAS